MIRRYGEPVVSGQRYEHRAGVYAILPRDGQLLMTFQGNPHFELQLPGGGIDPGEQPLTALYREVFEETGWSIAAPRKIGAYRRFCYMPEYDKWAEKLCHIYLAEPIRKIGPPSEPEHTGMWIDAELAAEAADNDGACAMIRALF